MALDNTFTFSLDRDGLITKAHRLLGVISSGQSAPTANEISSASNSLNLMLKAWQADGMQLWQTVELAAITPTSSDEYVFGDAGATYTSYKPTDILEVYRADSEGVWVPLIRTSRTDFNALSNHTSEGTPVNFYYNNELNATRSVSEGVLRIWPIADANFIANSTLRVLLTKPFDDMLSTDSTLAFPQEWELAVVYGLAVILAPEFGIPLSNQRLMMQQATIEKQRVLDWDQEHTSVFFTPEYRHA